MPTHTPTPPSETPGASGTPEPTAPPSTPPTTTTTDPGNQDAVWPAPMGQFTTYRLVEIAQQLRELGWSPDDVTEQVYVPFIIKGRGAWVNTWGAPRYGPGSIVRTHEGQDVFCDLGAPVLASEAGVIEFDTGLLGGNVARLHRSDGSYFYYAHLSAWNTDQFSSGDHVEPGDVIGYCGNTGNAVGTHPHVHFGWYQPSGEAQDPMQMLIGWLETAEQRASKLVIEPAAVQATPSPVAPLPVALLDGGDTGDAPSARLQAEPVADSTEMRPSDSFAVAGLLLFLLWSVVPVRRRR